MIKETETEKTIGFLCSIFIIGGISIWGKGAWAPGYPYGLYLTAHSLFHLVITITIQN